MDGDLYFILQIHGMTVKQCQSLSKQGVATMEDLSFFMNEKAKELLSQL